VLDDQPPAGIEKTHVVIAESSCEYLLQNAERIVNAQRVGRLAEPDSCNVKGRPPLNENNLHSASCKGRGGRKSAADTTSDD
jgi:hypothetical protein